MKSQVSALLHVLQGIHMDIQAAYPELMEDLQKDYMRIARQCQSRGLGFFTLDLPCLSSLLLRGLEEGRLSLEGPLSTAVSKRIQVPRLYSGLWLRIFDINSNLKSEVDVTAVFFLDQALCLGKKLLVECSYDRVQATVGAYHDIERQLRPPSLDWSGDELGIPRFEGGDSYRHLFGIAHRNQLDLFETPEGATEDQKETGGARGIDPVIRVPESLHLVEALAHVPGSRFRTLPLLTECEDTAELPGDRVLLTRIQQVADCVIDSWDLLDPIRFAAESEQEGKGIGFKHGPGAVAERKKNWEKSQFPNWPLKLQGTFPYEYCGVVASAQFGSRPPNHEVASRLIHVAKTSKSPRLIAAEPVSHQWCQQLVLRYMFGQCKRLFGESFIDFHDQTKSGDLVLKASLDRSMATVDLSDASDRLSCWTVERMFRKGPTGSSILLALHAARTRYLRDEISEVPGFLSLKKFASQGTATTFPVMSLVMLFIALGCTLRDDEEVTLLNIEKYRDQVRVFGDDIILPTHGYERLLRAMILLQLKVNVAKSYVNGYYRESCGTNAYLGYDVSPVKPRTVVADSPASCQAVVDNSNNLFIKGLFHASNYMLDLLPPRLRRGIRIVGHNDAGFRGVTSYSGSHECHLTNRWNFGLCRREVRVWTLSVRTERHPREGLSALLDFFASKHNHEHARIVSEYADVRKTRIGLLWEPANSDALLSNGKSGRPDGSNRSDRARTFSDRPVHHRLFEEGTGRRRIRDAGDRF